MSTLIGRLTKGSIVKESTWGTLVTPTVPLSVISNNIVNKITTKEDPRLVGQLFTNDLIKVAVDPGGGLNLTAHPNEVGLFLNGVLAKNDAPGTSPTGRLIVCYTGTDAYADLVMASGTLTGASGANVGGKVSAFALDTSLTANNTLAKVAALINAVTGWHAYVFGDGSSPSSSIVDFTLFVVNQSGILSSKIMSVASSSTTSKEHHIYPGAASDSWPSFSIMKDLGLGTNKAYAYVGCKFENVTLKASASNFIELSANVVAKNELIGQTYPAIFPAVDSAYAAASAVTIINGIQSLSTKDLTIAINPAMDKSHIVGDFAIMEPVPTGANIKVSGSANMDITDYPLKYADYVAVNPEEMIIYIENAGYADQANDVKYSLLFVINSFKWDKYESPISGPGRLTVSFEATTVFKTGVNHIDCYVVDTDTSAY